MKEKVSEKMDEFPDNPPWTMFFDGPLYQKYDEFMKTKDFSKILLNTKLRLANSPVQDVASSAHSTDPDHWDKEQEADPTENTYQYVSEDYHQRIKEEEKRRTRRTRAFIIIGLVIMAALAFGTALVIHYIFLPNSEETNPHNIVNVSFTENTTASSISDMTGTTTINADKEEMSRMLNNLLEGSHHHPHDHDHVHIHNPGGKIFDDHIMTSTVAIPIVTTSSIASPSTSSFAKATSSKAPNKGSGKATTTTPSIQNQSTKTAMYLLNLKPKGNLKEELDRKVGMVSVATAADKKKKQYTSTMDLNHMDFFGMDEFQTTTKSLMSSMSDDKWFALDDLLTPVSSVTPTKTTTDNVLTGDSKRRSKIATTRATTSSFTTLPKSKTDANVTDASNVMLLNTNVTSTTEHPHGTSNADTNTVLKRTTSETVSQSSFKIPVEITTATNSLADTIRMHGVTSYTYETARINCSVKHAIKWRSLSMKIDKSWRPLEVTLFPTGEIKWSRAKTKRHDVTYDMIDSMDGTGSNLTISLIVNDVQCRDGNTYLCTLQSDIEDRVARGRLTVVGKPSHKITLTLGPSIIEDRAFRITATWQGGYPIPWANMSWSALDAHNKSYNLAEYGEYRDYELQEDHKFCQTTLKHSIVVFPRIHLNDTTVIVKPNLDTKKYFVDKSMEKYLTEVEPGVDRILVIPLNYCKSGEKDVSIPHPYTRCTKFLRCLPGNIVVQQCPVGTCFHERGQQCAR